MVVRQDLTDVMLLTSGSDASRRRFGSRTKRACELRPYRCGTATSISHNINVRERCGG